MGCIHTGNSRLINNMEGIYYCIRKYKFWDPRSHLLSIFYHKHIHIKFNPNKSMKGTFVEHIFHMCRS